MLKLKLRFYARDILNILLWGRNGPKSAELIFIDPCSITHVLQKPISRKQSGKVLDSDWDLNIIHIHELPKVAACRAHFIHNIPWENSGAWELMADLFKVRSSPDNCSSWVDVEERYSRLDELYKHLKEGGRFKSQAELSRTKKFRERGGVHVHFNRDGEPVFGAGGCHRLAIAQILKLPYIPAQLGVVHKNAINIWRSKLITPITKKQTGSLFNLKKRDPAL